MGLRLCCVCHQLGALYGGVVAQERTSPRRLIHSGGVAPPPPGPADPGVHVLTNIW